MADTLLAVPSWIAACCASADDRSALAAPIGATWGGAPALFATNGHAFVLLLGEYDLGEPRADAPNPSGVLNQAYADLVEAPARVQRLRLDDLRDFVGITPLRTRCSECESRRRITCCFCGGIGGTSCNCQHCGDPACERCADCRGTGRLWCRACSIAEDARGLRSAYLGAAMVDVRYLERPLAHLADETARWCEPERADRLRALIGDGWVIGMMPVQHRDDDGIAGVPRRFLAWVTL